MVFGSVDIVLITKDTVQPLRLVLCLVRSPSAYRAPYVKVRRCQGYTAVVSVTTHQMLMPGLGTRGSFTVPELHGSRSQLNRMLKDVPSCTHGREARGCLRSSLGPEMEWTGLQTLVSLGIVVLEADLHCAAFSQDPRTAAGRFIRSTV